MPASGVEGKAEAKDPAGAQAPPPRGTPPFVQLLVSASQIKVWAARRPEIQAVVWFHYDKETDWRIDSSASAAEAFALGLTRLRG